MLKEIGLAESVIFGLLCSEYNLWQSQGKLKEGEKFYITIDRLKENTGLSYHQQQRAIKNLDRHVLESYNAIPKALTEEDYMDGIAVCQTDN